MLAEMQIHRMAGVDMTSTSVAPKADTWRDLLER